MLDLSNHSLNDTIPSSIANDDKVQNIIKAIDSKLREIHEESSLVLFMPRLEELGETLIDELAWQFHVDFYDATADISRKRELVRQSIKWHRIKGTPKAVEDVVTVAFGSAKVVEWPDYGAEPFHFKVSGITEAMEKSSVIDKVLQAIEDTKNVRSWCDGISFSRELHQIQYMGLINSTMKSISIKPTDITIPDITVNAMCAGANGIFKEVKIK